MPTEPRTTLPLSVEDLDLVVTTLEDQGHAALPQLRWLLLGPYAAAKLFPPYFCLAPTRDQIEGLLFALEQGGQKALAHRIQTLAGRARDHLERQLDYLETLPREEWHHPAQILRRPWELEDLLNLCRLRMDMASSDRLLVLESIMGKLEKAQKIEARAAQRRHLRTLSGSERREQRRHG